MKSILHYEKFRNEKFRNKDKIIYLCEKNRNENFRKS